MNNIFGTDGIRGTCGLNWITPSGTHAIGHAIGSWLKHQQKPISIAIASDTRASRHAVRAWLQSALSCYPYHIVDYGILPTPALVAILMQQQYTCGIMITASHNSHRDNGIKIYGPHGAKLTQQEEETISEHAHNAWKTPQSYEQHNCNNPSCTYASITISNAGLQLYKQYVYARCMPNLRGITIVLDTAAGATHVVASSILENCGAHIIPISPEPNGYNINHKCGSTHPQMLQNQVIQHHADIGFAFDGDGDRVIAVNRNGTVIDGDDILALLLHHPAYRDQSCIVSTVMSNMGLEAYCQHSGIKLEKTAVGDKHVAQRMYEQNACIGGEPSGHILLADMHITGDGIITALRLLESIIATGNWDMVSFEKYTQITYTIPIKTYKSLNADPLRSIIATYNQQIDGRIYARYSGTEPVMRLLIESKDEHKAHIVGEQAQAQLSEIIGTPCNE